MLINYRENLYWILGHRGIVGNETADEFDNQGAATDQGIGLKCTENGQNYHAQCTRKRQWVEKNFGAYASQIDNS